jgi:hypothetical protein
MNEDIWTFCEFFNFQVIYVRFLAARTLLLFYYYVILCRDKQTNKKHRFLIDCLLILTNHYDLFINRPELVFF